ncbi:tripartite tricarboxylate transporter TctB family protein [Oscillibacter sp.]|uniref:tripartite tricarboxylate transporter TctB family protein n=1 Tax=Oscillibacter sp. TaxID=1945593 RepID=UPI00289AB397|nr:tripartite tricarboxylate transporter TctB family protein [Oscillibacter sp.]
MEKKKFNTQALVPIVTAVFAAVFIFLGIKQYGFWNNQPMPGFFPVIIAVILLASSIASIIQIANSKDQSSTRYNKNELMVILGGAGIIIGTYVVGLIASCLIYLFIWLKFVERASWKTVVIVEIILAAIILGVFVSWLQVRFPMGLFQYIL